MDALRQARKMPSVTAAFRTTNSQAYAYTIASVHSSFAGMTALVAMSSRVADMQGA